MTDKTSTEVQTNGTPPIDAEVPVVGYSLQYGFGEIGSANADTFQIRLFIYDARALPDGSSFKNELYVLKDSLYQKLPDAFQFPNGVIRFFAFESQLPAVLSLLSNSSHLWL